MSPPAGVVDGLLAGRYRLASLLGSGANGEVWRAHDERLGRDVAVKVLRPELADDEDVRARFRAEARHAGRLRHPGIAAVFDFAEHDDGAWLVMELVDGQPLSAVLRSEGRLPVDRTLDVLAQAAGALQAAHDGGVVHRDVKPGNLLLRADGRLSVTDFGIAHATGAAALTRTGQVVGTASYLSPEQASGAPVSPATDLYALGVVAHECLSGSRPFERDDPVAVLLAHLQASPPPLPADVPAPVADLVHRLMAKEPAARPASAGQVQLEAVALRRDLAVPVSPTAVLATPAATPAAGPAAQPTSRRAVLGLAGRPGQRRAVRATALALGLLAVALGVRDAADTDAPRPPAVPQPAATSVPTAPATQDAPAPTPVEQERADTPPADTPPADTGPDTTGEAPAAEAPPAVVPQDEPVQQPAPAQQDRGAARGTDPDEQLEQQREQVEKQQEQQDKLQEKQEKEQEKQEEKEQGGGRG